eukprot:CAMPEP_0202962010 /NCGR_PEP_ID=MMETSP1396-20130829/6106_1 /ASSEMBLY_ACC=CAM_ASM_000872 /TAXON_ID= /ORGANISM="Pseudokeronopsis sp., Strain Brazil" /LENGTH=65 /DNA_ID=CAMNT_0049682283 /DNA_START=1102 /DNA_END=1302 /DNA_ORIENTATION=-
MPIMNGMEAAKELRRLDRSGRICLHNTLMVVHSAIQQTVEWRGLFDAILSKPVNFVELRDLLGKV